jgi:cytochrome c oxidase subunit 2
MKRACALALLLCGCHGRQSVLDPAGDQSAAILDMWHLMLVVCGLMYVLVMMMLAWAIWRVRRGASGPGASTAGDDQAHRWLRSWSVLIVVGLFVLATGSFLIDRRLAGADDANALKVRITASEWWWQVEYLDQNPTQTFTTANELHLPVNRATRLELRSADVIHSFWVPNLNGKTDLIPGHTNAQTVTPRRLGTLRGQCAEFCGLEHARMAMDVTVDTEAGFQKWRTSQLASAHAPATVVERTGQRVFLTRTCAMCHAIGGTDAAGHVGPDLTHLASRPRLAAGALPMEATALSQWITNPHGAKPGTNMPATDMPPDDLAALVTYLMSLK